MRIRNLALALAGLAATSLLFACRTPPAPSAAAPDPIRGLARVTATGELRVGMSGDQPPMNIRTQSGDWLGFDVALVRVLADNLGVKANLVQRPFFQLLDALDAGEVDVVVSGMTINARRNRRAAFVGPYFVSGKSILAKSSTIGKLRGIPDLNQPEVRLAALAGSTSEEFVARVAPKAQVTLPERLSEAIDLLLSDRVDAVVADYQTCVLARLRYPDEDLEYVQETLTVEPMGIAVPPEDTLLANLLENYLEALQLNGGLERIREFWFEDGTWLKELEERKVAGPPRFAAPRATPPDRAISSVWREAERLGQTD